MKLLKICIQKGKVTLQEYDAHSTLDDFLEVVNNQDVNDNELDSFRYEYDEENQRWKAVFVYRRKNKCIDTWVYQLFSDDTEVFLEKME